MALARKARVTDNVRRFRRARRGAAAIEFAIGATVLFIFIFGIINLGFLALTENGLQNGVANAALAFDAGASPPFNGSNAPSVTVKWYGPTSGLPSGCTSLNLQATSNYVTVSISYFWKPVAMAYLFNNGIQLTASDTEAVMGPNVNSGQTS
jgi:Flp pilus assembly pilin Flp